MSLYEAGGHALKMLSDGRPNRQAWLPLLRDNLSQSAERFTPGVAAPLYYSIFRGNVIYYLKIVSEKEAGAYGW